MASREVWHFEKVSIKDSEYAKKCGLKGDCYFWVSKGLIKIEQLDRKTSFQITVSHIRWKIDEDYNNSILITRNWGASNKLFFLELGTRSPTGHGRLEMTHKDPNFLRLLVRDTTSSSKQRKDVPVTKEATDEYVSDSEQDDYGYNTAPTGTASQPTRKKNPASGDSESATPVQSSDLPNEKWYKKNAVESEESEEAIPVRRTMDGRHVEAGDERDVYMVPQTKRK